MTSPNIETHPHADKQFEIRFTLFRDRFARFKETTKGTLERIATAISTVHAGRKEDLPLIKLALFADLKSDKGSLRWDNNVTSVTGCEADYDGGKISFDDARILLAEAGIACILYTSPSHTEEHPRWRVLAPFKQPRENSFRAIACARLNGVLHGNAAPESFTLSQSYYYGYITSPPHVDILEGDLIDTRNDLDTEAIGKGGKRSGPTSGNGASPHAYTDLDELIRRIIAGEALHPSVTSIAGKYAAWNVPKQACVDLIGSAFEAAHQDRYTHSRWKECLRTIDDIYTKEETKHTPNPEPEAHDPNWKSRWHLTKKNTPLANLHNVLLTLRNAEEFKGLLAYDQMLCSPMIVKSAPTELTNNDLTDLQLQLQIIGLRTASLETTKQAAVRHAKDNSYHPIRNSFTQLAKEWDRKSRVETWMTTYAGCEDTEYHRRIGTFFLRQIVKRVFEPGCKADYMLILEGPQGLQKSKIIRILAGGEKYFSDNLPELDDRKECSQHLRGLLLIEIAEMDTFTRAEVETLKAFLSRQYERYRPPYEPAEVNEPRQCSFVGTANKETYLRDETGNRRYWGARCGTIEIKKLENDRDQLIGEAVSQFFSGEPTYPTPEWEKKWAHPQQDQRFEEDPWTDPIRGYINGLPRVSIIDILTATGCLDIPKSQIDPFKGRRVASILRKLRWTSKRTETERYWVPSV